MNKLFILLVVALLIGCNPEKKQDARTSFTTSLDSLLALQFPAGQPGGAVLVAKGDSVVFSKGYGIADMNTKEAITTKTLFNLGSISKTFVANGILMLREEGKLKLEDSIIAYFPKFKNKGIGKKVKLKHLLTHSSGLPDNRQVYKDSVFYLTAKDAENWYPVTQTDTLVFEPGEQFEYSNPAFNGLALIIEQLSGKKWQSFIDERIFTPSGMTSSTITDGAHPSEGVSHGYVMMNGNWKELDYGEEPTFCAAGNGGVWSSVEELMKYEMAMRNATFSKASVLAESKEVKTFSNCKSSQPPFIGWAWFVETTSGNLKTVGHTGTQGGFHCNYVTIPEKGIFYVMLANFPVDREKLAVEMINLLQKAEWLDEKK